MPAFVSPIQNLAAWTLARIPTLMTSPAGMRYAGYSLPGVRATHNGTGGPVCVPATGILRRVTFGNTVAVEVQVNPFPIRRVVNAIEGGLPTFYLVFDDLTGLTFADGETAPGGEVLLRTATAVTVMAIGQDRIALDPAVWTSRIGAAIAAAGGNASEWSPFETAVGAIGAGATSPVLLYDHAGQLRTAGSVDVVFGAAGAESVYRVTMTPADAGDLQRAVQRMNAPVPPAAPITNLWGRGATSFRLRPVADAGAAQLVRLGDGLTAAGEGVVTQAQSSVAFTDLHAWFAPQFTAATPLRRFTRGNLLTPLVNGPEYFDDLFAALRDAQAANCGFHLAGWSMSPQTKFVKRTSAFQRDGRVAAGIGDDYLATTNLAAAGGMLGTDMIPVTLEQAADLIGAAGGKTRFLPSKLFQLLPGQTLLAVEALGFFLVIDLIAILNILPLGVVSRAVRTDTAGLVALLIVWVLATVYTAYLLANDGNPIEQNLPAVEVLGALTGAKSVFAKYPARVEDNSPAPDMTASLFRTAFTVIRHFSVYHQKLAVVRTPTTTIGYCGGIDIYYDRLDDADHLLARPFHDAHCRIEGDAVTDLAVTFQERWQHDVGDTDFAFAAPTAPPTPAPGTDIVQIGRTYFAAAAGSARGFPFAPDGDRTIADTILAAIAGATESIYIEDQYLSAPDVYRTALVGKVQRREIRQLIITVPGLADQPFGEGVRDSFVNDLMVADGGARIVRVGYPRRRFTSTDSSLRASAGKLQLMQPLLASGGVHPTIFLGPKSRLPALPFWVSVDGELIYVYNESLTSSPSSDTVKAFLCERGASTGFVRGGSSPVGTWTREHMRGAAATVVDFSSIYVHAKLMIVDDVFLGIGSANLNRRGFFYDGEINAFTIPAALRASPRNPALILRKRLWAEMLDLPAEMLAPLLTDPLASGSLFDRSPFVGNRYTRLDARPANLMLGVTTGDGAIMLALNNVGFGAAAANRDALFAQVVDPASRTEGP